MAKSRSSTRDPPPVQSEEESGEEEVSSSEEENEGSESESEPEPKPPRTQNPQFIQKPEPQPSNTQSADSSSDDEESDSETDSDSPIKKPDPNIKPIASKPMPMDDAQKASSSKKPKSNQKAPSSKKPRSDQKATSTKKPRSKPNTSGPTSPAKPAPSAGTKRPSSAAGATDGKAKDSKRLKKKPETGVETSEGKAVSVDDPKKLFQRLWSEDDEIVILQGMIDYRAKNKADPTADLNAFLEFIKKSIHVNVSKSQLQDKIRRLKKKYENNFSKEKKGKEKVSSKPHEQIAYELSKKIWGTERNAVDHNIGSPKANWNPKANGTAVKSGTKNSVAPAVEVAPAPAQKLDERENTVKEDDKLGGEQGTEWFKGVFLGLGNWAGMENWIARNGKAVIKGKKREEMEENLKKLNVKESEVHVKKLELLLEEAKSLLEGLKSSGN